MSRLPVLSLPLIGVLALAACGSGSPATPSSGPDNGGGRTVVTSFYPIEFATKAIAGDRAAVTVLTKPGAEPHDLELGAQDVAILMRAATVIYAKGFQPAVDEAVEQVEGAKVLDVAASADLEAIEEHEGEQTHADETAAPDETDAPDEHGGLDPHFWLDPLRYASVAEAIGARLAQGDPANAATITANTKAFVDKLTTLDAELVAGLKQCTVKDLVTSHAAFRYLAERYGFEQHSIAGLSPEAEPSAAALAEVTQLVKREGVTTIYQETLVEPVFAQTVASATGAKLATLDPVEGITAESAAGDYFGVMRANLEALRQGQRCR